MAWLGSWHVPHDYGALLQRRHDGVQQLLQTERYVALRGTRGLMHTRLPGDVAATIARMARSDGDLSCRMRATNEWPDLPLPHCFMPCDVCGHLRCKYCLVGFIAAHGDPAACACPRPL